MRIAVNTRLLIKDKLDGIGWFTYETIRRIADSHPEHEFIYIFDRHYDKSFITSPNIKPVVIGPQARHPFLFWIWFEFSVKRILNKYKADVFVSPDGYVSLSAKTKTLAVIHDLNFEHYPKDLPWLSRKYYKYFFPRFAKRADHIATVSEFSKSDIIQLYHIEKDKIDVVYNGANENFCPLSDEEINNFRKKHSNGKPYFIFIGALHPRKNVANLLKAYDLFRNTYEFDIPLIIAGFKMWWTKDMEKTYKGLKFKKDVIFIGRQTASELHKYLASALALTYVSTFEGFGIPIVESFYCGTAVITSNVTSMPEIAGDAAIFADPFSVQSICDAMFKIASDDELRKNLIQKGNIRKQNFSWNKSAESLWQCIEKLIQNT
jgi:glycosyltransferase involved in cell wall biosynthesis